MTVQTTPEQECSIDRKLEVLAHAEKIFQETLFGGRHKRVAEDLLDVYDPKSMTREQQRAFSIVIKFCRTKVMEAVHEQN